MNHTLIQTHMIPKIKYIKWYFTLINNKYPNQKCTHMNIVNPHWSYTSLHHIHFHLSPYQAILLPYLVHLPQRQINKPSEKQITLNFMLELFCLNGVFMWCYLYLIAWEESKSIAERSVLLREVYYLQLLKRQVTHILLPTFKLCIRDFNCSMHARLAFTRKFWKCLEPSSVVAIPWNHSPCLGLFSNVFKWFENDATANVSFWLRWI